MKATIFAASAFLALSVLSAQAQSPAASTQAAPGQRCDKDGCWTYDCDSTSNHCHRHWVSSTPRDANYHPASHADQVCDMQGENCQDATAPR
ncbi:MAG TPA: hypothetical protein VGG48_05720 [Rhizomicrobium sp.]|jgi:invasion protein IalB